MSSDRVGTAPAVVGAAGLGIRRLGELLPSTGTHVLILVRADDPPSVRQDRASPFQRCQVSASQAACRWVKSGGPDEGGRARDTASDLRPWALLMKPHKIVLKETGNEVPKIQNERRFGCSPGRGKGGGSRGDNA
jgi:hypothetical protein